MLICMAFLFFMTICCLYLLFCHRADAIRSWINLILFSTRDAVKRPRLNASKKVIVNSLPMFYLELDPTHYFMISLTSLYHSNIFSQLQVQFYSAKLWQGTLKNRFCIFFLSKLSFLRDWGSKSKLQVSIVKLLYSLLNFISRTHK